MKLQDFGGPVLLLCLGAGLAFAWLVLAPFMNIFLVALVLAVIARPVYLWMVRQVRGRKSLASFLTCVLVVVLLILPCLVILSLVAQESLSAYEWVNQRVQEEAASGEILTRAAELQQRYLPNLDLDPANWGKRLAGAAGSISQMVIGWSAGAVKAMTSAVWKFFLMLFALFYFFRDGEGFLSRLGHLMPLPASLEEQIAGNFREVSRSAFYGTFLTALAQGALGGAGFAIAGLQPLVWGVVMAFFSIIPVVGTAIVWAPASLLLLVSGHVGAGIFLALWGGVVVGMSDNFLRPLLMRGKNELHPMLVFFSLVGGIGAFGLLGILLGPLAMVLVITLVKAYEEAAKPILNELDGK
ncbi:MAG: AI-2E family transporter [Pseudomonadota bacterium]